MGKKEGKAGGPDDDETNRGQWSGPPVRKFRLTTTHADIRNGNIPGFFHATTKWGRVPCLLEHIFFFCTQRFFFFSTRQSSLAAQGSLPCEMCIIDFQLLCPCSCSMMITVVFTRLAHLQPAAFVRNMKFAREEIFNHVHSSDAVYGLRIKRNRYIKW